jgi:hypothetical protein
MQTRVPNLTPDILKAHHRCTPSNYILLLERISGARNSTIHTTFMPAHLIITIDEQTHPAASFVLGIVDHRECIISDQSLLRALKFCTFIFVGH